jgi:type I restriction enzyme M protein
MAIESVLKHEDQEIQKDINTALWAACDTFRGAFDSSEYKNYILVFMFVKYLSDVWKDHYAELQKKYGDNQALIERKMQRERFYLPKECTFDELYANRNKDDIGQRIDEALAQIESRNQEKLEGVFRNISFNSDKLGQTKDRNRRLKNLLDDFGKETLDFRPSRFKSVTDVLGQAYMYLLEKFASGSGKKGGEFFTPTEVSHLLARLVNAKPGDRIYDPTCGSASLLIQAAELIKDENGEPSSDFAIYGQESNGDTWALSKMNCFIHEMDSAQIEWGDTIGSPRLLEESSLMRFNVVLANPPFSLDKWGYENAEADPYRRFTRGLPPKSKGDYAFILHMIESLLPKGRMGVIVPHGVLFRGGGEGKIREQLVRENLLDTVVGLPTGLFYGTGIPAAILIFNKAKEHSEVMFIDASNEYGEGKNQNKLREQDLDKICDTYFNWKVIDKYSYSATLEEMEENDFNLNIPRYVDTFEEEEEINLNVVSDSISSIESDYLEIQQKMRSLLKELNL